MAAHVALGKLKERGHESSAAGPFSRLAKIGVTIALFTSDPEPTPATVSHFCSFLMTAKCIWLPCLLVILYIAQYFVIHLLLKIPVLVIVTSDYISLYD